MPGYPRRIAPTFAPGDTGAADPPPPAPTFWEGFWATQRDVTDRNENDEFFRHMGAYQDLAEALGKNIADFPAPVGRQFSTLNPFHTSSFEDYVDADGLWAAYQANPHRDPEIAKFKTRQEFDQYLNLRGDRHAKDAEVSARAGTGSRLAGGMFGGLTDPANAVMSFAGGGGKTFLGTVGRAALLNMGIETIQTPANMRGAAAVGEPMTATDALERIGMAGFGGGVLGGTFHGLGKVRDVAAPHVVAARDTLLAKLILHLPAVMQPKVKGLADIPDGTLADAMEAMVGKDNLGPDMTAALNVVRRDGEFAASNPYVENFAGIKAHGDALQEAMDRIMGSAPQGSVRGALGQSTALRSGMGAPGAVPAGAAPDAAAIAEFKRAIGRAESPNDFAKNPGSSARGRYQFTNDTWLRYHDKVFGNTGESKAAVLAKKTDGGVQEALMNRMTGDHIATLRAMGAPVTKENLYIMHFGGEAGGPRLLEAADNAPIREVLGDKAVDANRFLEGMTAAQARAELARRVGGKAGPAVPGGGELDMTALEAQQAQAGLAAAEGQLAQGGGPLISEDVAALSAPLQHADVLPEDIPVLKAEALHQDTMVQLRPLVADRSLSLNDPAELASRLGIDEAQVRGALDGLVNRGELRVTAKGTYRRIPDSVNRGPEDMLQFIAHRGGLSYDGLDVQGRALGTLGHDLPNSGNLKHFVPGSGPLLRPHGHGLDRMGELLHDAGYFGPPESTPRPTDGELITLIDDAIRTKEKRYSVFDQAPEAKATPQQKADHAGFQSLGHYEGELARYNGAGRSILGRDLTHEEFMAALAIRREGSDVPSIHDQAHFSEASWNAGDDLRPVVAEMVNREIDSVLEQVYHEVEDPFYDVHASPDPAPDNAAGREAGAAAQRSEGQAADPGSAGSGGEGAGNGLGASDTRSPDPLDVKPLDPQTEKALAGFDDPVASAHSAEVQNDSAVHDLHMLAEASPETMVKLDAESDPIPLADFLASLDDEVAAVKHIEGCMAPPKGV